MHKAQLTLNFDRTKPKEMLSLEQSDSRSYEPTARSLGNIRPKSNRGGIGDSILLIFLRKESIRARIQIQETVTEIRNSDGIFDHGFLATIFKDSERVGHSLGAYHSPQASYHDSELPELWQEIKDYIQERNYTLVVGELRSSRGRVRDTYLGEFKVSKNPFIRQPST